jgi:asparagine synthase (glutamine-hydrolysing)
VADTEVYVMSPLEIVCGYVFGTVGTLPVTRHPGSPRDALERVVRGALQRSPCGVSFSGGRDSSAVLAIATHVARRDGLPDPVPITKVYPDVVDADESRWQEQVIRYLGLQDWQRVVIHDELDLVGPVARDRLVTHGVMWPPTIGADLPVVDALGRGSLIDGEGGDEVLGDGTHRIAPLARLIRSPRPVRRRRLLAGLEAVGPARFRLAGVRRFWGADATPWLRPAGREALLSALYGTERSRPLSFAASVRTVPGQRHHVLAARNRRLLAAQRGVDVSSPLVHPDVVAALARHGGVLGPGDRTAALRTIVADLLPDDVIARTTKAVFTNCYLGRHTREFAAGWNGSGVDADLVDAEALRRQWLGDQQHALTAALLQSAWLAGARRTPTSGDAHRCSTQECLP